MTPEEQANLDRQSAMMMDMYAPMWHRLYTNLQNEGFSEANAFKLVQTYILSLSPSGINGT